MGMVPVDIHLSNRLMVFEPIAHMREKKERKKMSKLSKRVISIIVIATFLISMIPVFPVSAAELYTDVTFFQSESTATWAVDPYYGDVVMLDTVGAATGSDYAVVRMDVDTTITLATIAANLPTFMYNISTADAAGNFLALELFFNSTGGGWAEIGIFPYTTTPTPEWDNTPLIWQEATGHSGATFAIGYGETNNTTPFNNFTGGVSLTSLLAFIDAVEGIDEALSEYELTRVGVQIGWVTVTDMVALIDYIDVDGVTYDLAVVAEGAGFSIDYVTPGDIDYGDVLTVVGSGVTSGSTIEVYWDTAVGSGAQLLNSTTGNPDASFDVEIKIPSDVVGDHYLWVKDVATLTTVSYGPLNMLPKITLSPSSGLVGDEITLKGYGFSAESEITVTFDVGALTTSPATVETDEDGYFTATFDVPDKIYADYTVVATDEESETDSATFTVGASLTLDVEEGPEGTVVEISGTGFNVTQVIDDTAVEWDGTAVPLIGDPVTVPASGEFTVEIVVPSTGEGEHTIMIHDDTGAGTDVTADFEIDGEASITVSPTYGAPGATITLTGANFTQIAGTEILLTLSTTPTATPLGEIVETNADGTFETTFTSPAVTFANYDVLAADALYGVNATDPFKVGMIALIINPTSGGSGTDVGITGVGFAEGDFNMTFGEELFEYPNGVGSDEIIADNFYVPNVDPGTYYVTVVDEDENELTVTFVVTESTTASVDPVVAPNLYNVSISGNNFADKAAGALTFDLYNSTDSWEDINVLQDPSPSAAVTDDDGNFTAYWMVLDEDTLSIGDYTINVTDSEDLLVQLDFSVVAARVEVTPRKTLFDRGDTVSFDISNDFVLGESYIEIYSPDDTLYWITDLFGDGTPPPDVWVLVDDLETIPYYRQTANANPMDLASDAPIGTWTYFFYDNTDEELMNGTFAVGPSTAAQVDALLEDVRTDLSGLAEDMAGMSDDFADDLAALSDGFADDMAGMSNDFADDIALLAGDIAAATDAGQAALNAVEDLAGSMADLGDAMSDMADLTSDTSDAAQSAADAANEAVQAANDAQDKTSGLTTLVYGAIGASLIAALAAIVSLMQISRRIAG